VCGTASTRVLDAYEASRAAADGMALSNIYPSDAPSAPAEDNVYIIEID
jgi:hypothetical protein